MNTKLLYGILAALLFWIAINSFRFYVVAAIVAIVIAAIMWKRRASILTWLASQAYYIKGDTVKGEKYFQKAYKTGEMTPNGKIQYSSFCLRENQFDKGRRLLNEIINSSKTSKNEKLDAKHNLSVLVWREGNLQEALEIIEEVHQQKLSSITYETKGVLLLEKARETQNYSEILPFMEEAYEYNDSDKTIADNLGETYLRLGEYEKAKEVYEKLLVNTFVTPMPYYNFGLVLKAMGENERAKENFEKALECRFTSVLTVTKEMVQKELDSLN